ncbi:MAG: outer membrane protein assembly factor BamD [Rickettsiales bacterium]|jgi:outer membrane protein assembly factor BamD|nr:outer membrane protein assembly factor BamD [Rickettsiales bacterium]
MKLKTLSVLCALCSVLCACGGDKIKPDQPLAEIYDEAYMQFEKKNYKQAADEFQNAERQFPATPWAANALVMAAYSAYMDDDFANAIVITDRFMRFHPGHQDIPYVLYLRGMSYYRQVSDVRREPGMSVYALQSFQQLVERFPKSPYAENAKNKILILKNYIAGKIMYSARRDMVKQNWPAAIDQLQQIVQGAVETVMTPEALYRLTEAYTAIGLPEQAAGFAEMLRLNFPDGEWTKKLR